VVEDLGKGTMVPVCARKADALGAGFPCHHFIDASMAVKDSVRKGSWVLCLPADEEHSKE